MPAGLDGNPDPIVTPARVAVLGGVADLIVSRRVEGTPLLVAIDGIDSAGKSTFADELAAVLGSQAVPIVRSTVDSFHHPRAVRYRRGKTSPIGFYLDSHDLAAVRRELLDPFRSGPGATYRTAAFDEPTDSIVEQTPRTVAGDEVLVFDGIFLCRPDLVEYWDVIIFLDALDRVNRARLGLVMEHAPSDGAALVGHVLTWVQRFDRYASGMRIYLDLADPMSRADVVIDNNDLANPIILSEE